MTDTTITEETSALNPPLEYPRNFFKSITGRKPENEAAAALLWPYRKDRPKKGAIEMMPANGALMLFEIKAMRDKLRASILARYLEGAREVASILKLTMSCGNQPVSPEDLKDALRSLESNSANHLLVYKICHEFHHNNRSWMANAIDNWFQEEHMVLLPESEDSMKRTYAFCRGTFGTVARQAKAQAVQALMQPMLSRANWFIATTNNIRDSVSLIYEKKFI